MLVKDSKGEENKVVTNGSTVAVTEAKDDDLPHAVPSAGCGGTEIASVQKSRSTRAIRQREHSRRKLDFRSW